MTLVRTLLHFAKISSIAKFIYSEKATKFCEVFPLLLTTVHTVKSKGKISQNFVALSEYMNFTLLNIGRAGLAKTYQKLVNVVWSLFV